MKSDLLRDLATFALEVLTACAVVPQVLWGGDLR